VCGPERSGFQCVTPRPTTGRCKGPPLANRLGRICIAKQECLAVRTAASNYLVVAAFGTIVALVMESSLGNDFAR
jgi:hypothetical protein